MLFTLLYGAERTIQESDVGKREYCFSFGFHPMHMKSTEAGSGHVDGLP
jgi:hypothetical protein